jgi:EAL domain-containing protein (putative c-di-GMP-specific phosphodiesterase class I)
MSASIGIVTDTRGYDRPEDLLRDADTAMYRAKAGGRARHELFDSAMREVAVQRLRLRTDLQRAVERHEFRLHYQPIVNLADARIAAFEALVRWAGGDRALVQPHAFIAVAEETGVIVPIGEWVLREGCRQVAAWQRQFRRPRPLIVSINISGKEFARPDLLAQISRTLSETGLTGSHLELEITEGLLMEHPDATTERLQHLRAFGMRLSIDDFGTGYSSLTRLHRFPVTTLKIDRSFVAGMGGNGENMEIVKAIVALAHNLGLDVIAEGIETGSQLAQLRRLGCEYGQGYYFAKPLEPAGAEALLDRDARW